MFDVERSCSMWRGRRHVRCWRGRRRGRCGDFVDVFAVGRPWSALRHNRRFFSDRVCY